MTERLFQPNGNSSGTNFKWRARHASKHQIIQTEHIHMPILLTAPGGEPLSLAEAKLHLRVAHDDEDDAIVALVAAARTQIETTTRRAFITQHWRVVRDCWPIDGRIVLA